jgi:hypothetical protein
MVMLLFFPKGHYHLLNQILIRCTEPNDTRLWIESGAPLLRVQKSNRTLSNWTLSVRGQWCTTRGQGIRDFAAHAELGEPAILEYQDFLGYL